MISRVFDLQRQDFIVVWKTCTFGIGIGIAIGVDIETECDTDPDPDNAVRAASSGSHNQASGPAGGPMTGGIIGRQVPETERNAQRRRF